MRPLFSAFRAWLVLGALLGLRFQASAQDTWAAKAGLPVDNRQLGVGFSIGSIGYIGMGFNNGVLADFWAYDPATDAWTQRADVPGGGRYGAIGFSIGTKGYIGAGAAPYLTTDFWEYDPVTNTWTQRADVPGDGRYQATGFSIGLTGYIGTGFSTSSLLADFWAYNPTANTWTRRADVPGTGRQSAIGFSVGNAGYIGTGTNGNKYLNDFWAYNPATNAWAQRADVPGEIRYAAIGFGNGLSGYVGSGFSSNGRLADFWEYNPATDTWAQRANVPGSGLYTSVSFSIGAKGYVGTGITTDYLTNFLEYSPPVPATITTSPLSASTFCRDGGLPVSFSTTGTFAVGNVFTAQLSDASGSFAAPLALGTLRGKAAGSISGTIPALTPAGRGYRVRVVSSDPAAVGTDNGSDLAISIPPTATLSGGGSIYPGGTATIRVDFTGTPPWTIVVINEKELQDILKIGHIQTSPYYLQKAPLVSTTYSASAVADASGCTNRVVTSSATVVVLPAQYALTVTPPTNGSISKTPSQTSYAAGAVVRLIATPAAGYQLGGWGGAASGNSNPLDVVMDANKSITATFAPVAPAGPQVSSFTLINADTEQPIQVLTSGTVLNLRALPTRHLNIRANTTPATVGSVRLVLSGTQRHTQLENVAPYALFSDTNGDYNAWTPALGSYSLTARPYAGVGASSAAGTPLTISFSVVKQLVRLTSSPSISSASGGAETAPAGVAFAANPAGADQLSAPLAGYSPASAYPNPSDGWVSVQLPAAFQGEVSYTLVSALGTKLSTGRVLLHESDSVLKLDFTRQMVATGVYVLHLSGQHAQAHLKLLRW